MDLQQAHTAAGLTCKRQKCTFGQVPSQYQPTESASSLLVITDGDVDVQDVMADLMQDASEDGNSHETDETDAVSTQAAPPTVHQPHTVAQRCILLSLLFSFTDPSPDNLLEFYWKGG